jgi:hypothetical protein
VRADVSAELLAERQAGLQAWKTEALAILLDWGVTLGLEPDVTREHPIMLIAPIDERLRDADIGPDELTASRILAFAGALLRWKHQGEWVVDDWPDSPSYARYVIEGRDGRRYDPSLVATGYLDDVPPRNLVRRLADAEAAAY